MTCRTQDQQLDVCSHSNHPCFDAGVPSDSDFGAGSEDPRRRRSTTGTLGMVDIM